MTHFATLSLPAGGSAGFSVVAGRAQGLRRLRVAGGRLPAGDRGPAHLHAGDEVIAELASPTFYPVIAADGRRRLVEVRRSDLPWSVPPVPPARLDQRRADGRRAARRRPGGMT